MRLPISEYNTNLQPIPHHLPDIARIIDQIVAFGRRFPSNEFVRYKSYIAKLDFLGLHFCYR